jgi:hypothetical protein
MRYGETIDREVFTRFPCTAEASALYLVNPLSDNIIRQRIP